MSGAGSSWTCVDGPLESVVMGASLSRYMRQADGTRLDDLPQFPTHARAVSWNLSETCLKFDATIYLKCIKSINANLSRTYTTECRRELFLVTAPARSVVRNASLTTPLQPNFTMD